MRTRLQVELSYTLSRAVHRIVTACAPEYARSASQADEALLKHWLAFAALGIVWGTTWIAADTLAESVPPLHGAAIRFLLAALLCIPLVVWKRLTLPRGRALGFVLLLSVTMVVLPYVLVLWAQQHVSSVTVTVLFAAMPLFVALLPTDGRAAWRAAGHGCRPGRAGPGTGPFVFAPSGRGRRYRAARRGIHWHFCGSCPPGTQGSASHGNDRVAVRHCGVALLCGQHGVRARTAGAVEPQRDRLHRVSCRSSQAPRPTRPTSGCFSTWKLTR